MMPIVDGAAHAPPILLYTLILAPLGLAPWLMGFAGLPMAPAVAGGAGMLVLALRSSRETEGNKRASKLFGFSILYLFLLFAVLLADRMSGGSICHLAV